MIFILQSNPNLKPHPGAEAINLSGEFTLMALFMNTARPKTKHWSTVTMAKWLLPHLSTEKLFILPTITR